MLFSVAMTQLKYKFLCIFKRLHMRSALPYKILACILGVTFISCHKELAFNNNSFEKQIVVESIFSPDSVWHIHLSSTKDIFDSNDQSLAINNADILLADRSENNQQIKLSTAINGHYKSLNAVPKLGHFYEIFIDAEGFQEVRATAYVPSTPAINIDYVTNRYVEDQLVYELNVSFQDNITEENYYVWEVIEVEEEVGAFTGLIYNHFDPDRIRSQIPNLNYIPEAHLQDNDRTLFLSDKEFNGNNFSTKIYAVAGEGIGKLNTDDAQVLVLQSEDGDSSDSSTTSSDTKLFLKVRSVSAGLYEYLKSIQDYNLQEAINPTNLQEVYTNIEGGVGIFGSYSISYIEIEL